MKKTSYFDYLNSYERVAISRLLKELDSSLVV